MQSIQLFLRVRRLTCRERDRSRRGLREVALVRRYFRKSCTCATPTVAPWCARASPKTKRQWTEHAHRRGVNSVGQLACWDYGDRACGMAWCICAGAEQVCRLVRRLFPRRPSSMMRQRLGCELSPPNADKPIFRPPAKSESPGQLRSIQIRIGRTGVRRTRRPES